MISKVRDRHAAAALGRPPRIQDDDCDVELLEEADFELQDTNQRGVFGSLRRYHALYMIQISKLAILRLTSTIMRALYIELTPVK